MRSILKILWYTLRHNHKHNFSLLAETKKRKRKLTVTTNSKNKNIIVFTPSNNIINCLQIHSTHLFFDKEYTVLSLDYKQLTFIHSVHVIFCTRVYVFLQERLLNLCCAIILIVVIHPFLTSSLSKQIKLKCLYIVQNIN